MENVIFNDGRCFFPCVLSCSPAVCSLLQWECACLQVAHLIQCVQPSHKTKGITAQVSGLLLETRVISVFTFSTQIALIFFFFFSKRWTLKGAAFVASAQKSIRHESMTWHYQLPSNPYLSFSGENHIAFRYLDAHFYICKCFCKVTMKYYFFITVVFQDKMQIKSSLWNNNIKVSRTNDGADRRSITCATARKLRLPLFSLLHGDEAVWSKLQRRDTDHCRDYYLTLHPQPLLLSGTS